MSKPKYCVEGNWLGHGTKETGYLPRIPFRVIFDNEEDAKDYFRWTYKRAEDPRIYKEIDVTWGTLEKKFNMRT